MVKHVQEVGGHLYFRRTIIIHGKRTTQRHRLPAYADPAFDVEYQRLLAERQGIKVVDGSMAQLVFRYRTTPEYRRLAPTTKATRDQYLAMIENKHGDKPFAALTKGKVKQLRNEMADTPGAANNFVAVLSVLFKCAIDLEMVAVNPCTGVERLRIGEHQPWPARDIERVMNAADPMIRLAVAVHLYTGQRISDVCRMKWSDVEDGVIRVRQQKTGKEIWVPIHSRLKDELALVPRHLTWLVYNQQGRQMKPGRLRERLNVIWRRLGIRHRWHGLRKNAVNYMLEAGCSTAEVAGITGQSLQVVEHYAKGRDVKALARSAMKKWEAK